MPLPSPAAEMDASNMQQQGDEEEEDTVKSIRNGNAADHESHPSHRNVKPKLLTSHSKHQKALSTSSLLSPPPPTALTPSSSAASLIHQLATQLNQLHNHSRSTVHTLRATIASPSLLPTIQHELDIYRADFASAASQLSTPIRTLSSHYSNRLEGAADECRSLSYRVSNSLSELSSSVAGTASEHIHSVYNAYRSLQSEHENCQLLVAVATRLHVLLEQLQVVKHCVDNMSWLAALDVLDAVRDGTQQLLAFDPHMATSAVYRRLQDEHDKWRSDMQGAVKAEVQRVFRFVHLNQHISSTSTSVQLPDELARLLHADMAAHYRDVTSDSEHKPSASSALVVLYRAYGANNRLEELQTVCERLSLSSTLTAHIQSVITRWFSSVIALVAAVGFEHNTFTLLTPHDEQWVAWCVQLGGGTSSSTGIESRSFELMKNMAFVAIDHFRWLVGEQSVAVRSTLSDTITSLVVEQLLPLTIPTSVTDLLSYATISKQVDSMNTHLDALSLRPSSAPPSRVSHWCAEINKHFLRSVRLVVLDRCRELLVNNDYQVYHAEQPAALSSALDSYPPLFFPTSTSPYLSATTAAKVSSLTPAPEPVPAPPVQLLPIRLQARVLSSYLASQSPISLHACLYSITLFELLGQSLHAFTASSDLSSSLLVTLCDCILLILSIPGVYNSDQLQSVGYMSWLYASDCSYLAVCVEQMAAFIVTECRLAPVSSTSFFPSIGGAAPPPKFASEAAVQLLALVDPLRAVSKHWKRHTLTQLTSAVITSLDALPPFTSLDSPTTLRTTLSSLHQTIHTLTRSLRSLRDVERTHTRQLIARRLVERLCDAVVERVLAVEDVGIEEAKGMEAAVTAVNCSEVREVVGGGWESRAWRRLEAVQLLIGSEQTLVKIEAEWEAGMLSALNGVEVCDWIRSLYQDSAKRQQLLQKIGGSGGNRK